MKTYISPDKEAPFIITFESIAEYDSAMKAIKEATDKAEAEGRIYPCNKCGIMRTKAEGGTTFTLCDKCWDEYYKPENFSTGS